MGKVSREVVLTSINLFGQFVVTGRCEATSESELEDDPEAVAVVYMV